MPPAEYYELYRDQQMPQPAWGDWESRKTPTRLLRGRQATGIPDDGHLPAPLWSAVTEQRQRQLTTPLTLPEARHYVNSVRELVDACRAHYERVTGAPLAVETPAVPASAVSIKQPTE